MIRNISVFVLASHYCEDGDTPEVNEDVDLDASSGNPNDAYDPAPGGWRPRGNDVCPYLGYLFYKLMI